MLHPLHMLMAYLGAPSGRAAVRWDRQGAAVQGTPPRLAGVRVWCMRWVTLGTLLPCGLARAGRCNGGVDHGVAVRHRGVFRWLRYIQLLRCNDSDVVARGVDLVLVRA